jgi:putative sterol carrier protein
MSFRYADPVVIPGPARRSGFSEGGVMAELTRSGTARFAALKDLTQGGQGDLAATFRNLAAMLEDAGFDVDIEYRIDRGGTCSTFSVRVTGGAGTVVADSSLAAALRVIVSEEAWTEIASGAVTPADAFLDGKMRVIGDTDLGIRMLRHLAGTPGRIGICRS